jgi:hypothetical protein
MPVLLYLGSREASLQRSGMMSAPIRISLRLMAADVAAILSEHG